MPNSGTAADRSEENILSLNLRKIDTIIDPIVSPITCTTTWLSLWLTISGRVMVCCICPQVLYVHKSFTRACLPAGRCQTERRAWTGGGQWRRDWRWPGCWGCVGCGGRGLPEGQDSFRTASRQEWRQGRGTASADAPTTMTTTTLTSLTMTLLRLSLRSGASVPWSVGAIPGCGTGTVSGSDCGAEIVLDFVLEVEL